MNRLSRIGIAAVVLLQALAPTVSAAPLSWQRVGSLPASSATGSGLGVAYGNGKFVVVERFVGTYTSPDGTAWTSHPYTTGVVLPPVKFLNGQFVAGGTSGNGKYLSVSGDGVTWRDVASGGTAPMQAVAYGKGRYIIGEASAYPAVLSSDLKTKTQSKTYLGAPLGSGAYGKGLFVGGGPGIFYSTDGLTWTQAVPIPGGPASGDGFWGAAYGEGRFVVVGRVSTGVGDFKGVIYTSTDGKQWEQAPVDAADQYAVTYGGGRFIVWGAKNSMLTSEDGLHWTAEAHGAEAMTYGAGKFIALGADRSVTAAVACGSRFADVAPDQSACDPIEALARQQVIAGYPDGSFRPGAAVTRAEMAKMLTLILGMKPEPQKPVSFPDAAGHWAARGGYLQAAVAAGVINGFPDGTFRPDEPVTRAQAAKMVAAAAGLKPEAAAGSEWFSGWVAAARSADLIGAGGYHSLWVEQAFQGEAAANRGETATLLDNIANQ